MAEAVVIGNSSEEDKEIQHELDGKQPNGTESLPLSDRNSPNHATNDKTHEALDQLRNVKTNDDDDYYVGLLEEAAEKYVYFWKSGSVFSQWHMSDFKVDGKKFHCAKQCMMYEKAMLFNDHEIAQLILKSKSPREIKKLGREVRGFVDEIWKYKCLDIVKKANVAKFSCNKKLLKEMVKTYPRTLVEASPYDSIWGIQLEESDPAAWSESTWLGTNYLGYILTEVRNDLMIEIGELTEDQRLNFVKEEQKKYEETYKMLTSSLKSSQAHESTTNNEKSSSKKNSVSGTNQPKKDNENNEDRSKSAKRSGKVTDGKSTKKEEANERNEEPSQTDDQTGGKKKKKKGGDKDSPGNAMVTIQDFELPSSYSSSSKDDEANPRNEPKDENVKKSNKKTDEKPCDVSDVSKGFDDVGSQANNEVNPPAPNRVKNGQVNPPALNEVRNGQVNPPALNEVKNGQENDEAPVAKVSRRQRRDAKRHSKQNKKKGGDKDSPGNAMVTIQDFELPSSYSSSSKDDEANPRNEPKDENVKKSNKKTDEKPCDVSDVSKGFDDVGSQANNEVNPPAPNRVKNGQVNPPALNEVRNGQVNPPALNEVKNGQENDEAPVAKVSRRQRRDAKRHSKQNKKKGGDKDSPGNAMVTIQDFELPSSYSSSSKDDEANPRNEPKDENVKKSNKKTDEKPCDVSDVSKGFDDVGSQANNEVNPPAPNRVKNGHVNPPALNEVRNGQVNPPALNEVKNGQENDEAPVAKVSRRQRRDAKRHSKQNN